MKQLIHQKEVAQRTLTARGGAIGAAAFRADLNGPNVHCGFIEELLHNGIVLGEGVHSGIDHLFVIFVEERGPSR